jgi:hypothetical protein
MKIVKKLILLIILVYYISEKDFKDLSLNLTLFGKQYENY